MSERLQCLKCGSVNYSGLPCESEGCDGICVAASFDMSEIATLFYLCGYAVSEANTKVLTVEKYYTGECFQICVRFKSENLKTILPDLPSGFTYISNAGEEENTQEIVYSYDRYNLLSKREKEMLLEDNLAALHAWLIEIKEKQMPD